MGFRFQKRIKLFPGVSLNLSKSGVSTSIGPRGAKVTVGNGRVRTTVGLPGTGISHTVVAKNLKRPAMISESVHEDEFEEELYIPQPLPKRKNKGYSIGRWIAKAVKKVTG